MDREYIEKINHYSQIHKLDVIYDTIDMTGPSHNPEFTVVVKINGVVYGTGTGKNKKEAKAVAAKETWEKIEEEVSKYSSNTDTAELMTTPRTSSPVLGKNYVGLLNTFSQKSLQMVDYPDRSRTGDAHAPIFTVSCTINGHLYGRGTGSSLAAAKQAAAKAAFEKVNKEVCFGNRIFWYYSLLVIVILLLCYLNTPLFFNKSSTSFNDSSAKLVENMKDMAPCEKPSPSQVYKLAANFALVRNKEEKKNMSNSDVDTNTRGESGSPYTINKIFLDNFKNIEPIGEGGFGNVFKATSECDKKTYAIKRVKLTKNVEREAVGLAKLTHENIVRYHCSWKGYDHLQYSDSSQNSDENIHCLFIQMEFCEKGTLEKWIAKNREDRMYRVMAHDKFLQIVKGVEYIHSEDLIHRDLKPQNIFISHDDKIKIGDFGLVTSVEYETLTENRGTKSYMAPEQFGDKYGKPVDVYAMGLIWFEILSAFTFHEKSKVFYLLKKPNTSIDILIFFLQAPIIKKMLSRNPSGRMSTSKLLDLLKSVDREKPLKNYSY
ncbi:E2AK2 kinase, partial [Climacteris rufus]|nr:E2AK2 kinase [Climacteris rufus]